ncbi:MAG: hypothetical protein FJX34_00865 [Alphaproteobacteria bacterium]|nr:hypothetical protein [Alphaproteobacteria bacterium]
MRKILLSVFILSSCSSVDQFRDGKVDLYNSNDSTSFVFTVSDDFTQKNKNSPYDKDNPKITEAESELLAALLTKRKICLDGDGAPLFRITSRQEKIFDVTFAHLIEQNYKARPVAPRMYFGRCLEKSQ